MNLLTLNETSSLSSNSIFHSEWQEEYPVPSYNHGYIQTNLAVALHKLQKYSIVTAVTIEIKGKPYIPDILVYPKRPLDLVHDMIQMTEMPLLAIEILSPTQGVKEMADKFEIYFQAGIQSCWLVVPFIASVTVYAQLTQSKTFTEQQLIDNKLDIHLSIAEIFS